MLCIAVFGVVCCCVLLIVAVRYYASVFVVVRLLFDVDRCSWLLHVVRSVRCCCRCLSLFVGGCCWRLLYIVVCCGSLLFVVVRCCSPLIAVV